MFFVKYCLVIKIHINMKYNAIKNQVVSRCSFIVEVRQKGTSLIKLVQQRFNRYRRNKKRTDIVGFVIIYKTRGQFI